MTKGAIYLGGSDTAGPGLTASAALAPSLWKWGGGLDTWISAPRKDPFKRRRRGARGHWH